MFADGLLGHGLFSELEVIALEFYERCLWKSLNSIRIFVWTEMLDNNCCKIFSYKIFGYLEWWYLWCERLNEKRMKKMKYNFWIVRMIERVFNRRQHWSNRRKIIRITRYGRMNRSIMRYRRTPTIISPWWFVKSSRSFLRFIFVNISCSSNHYFLLSDYHWISANWIFTVTNSILLSKNIRTNKKFSNQLIYMLKLIQWI